VRTVLSRDARFALHRFGTDVLAAHRGEALRERETVVAVARLEDGLALVALPSDVADVLEALGDASASEAWLTRAVGGPAVLAALVEASVLLRVALPTR
jgi:hypothetical protein